MLTIFTIPKPFRGHIEVIQRNAIESWLRLRPQCEIILCGDDPGVAEAASEYEIEHVPDIACNEYGTPLVSSAFEHVQQVAQHPLICYTNADIIFLSDLTASVKRITFPRFLVVGQRWDLDITTLVRFEEKEWEHKLREQALSYGTLHPPAGSDYFVFPNGTVGELPDFAVGRAGWDNWVIYRARSCNIPVIDATQVNMVIHQAHGYGHVPQKTGQAWGGPETIHNLELIQGHDQFYTLLDATHVLAARSLRPAWKYKYVRRRLVRARQYLTKLFRK
jgi:hypothetical protein